MRRRERHPSCTACGPPMPQVAHPPRVADSAARMRARSTRTERGRLSRAASYRHRTQGSCEMVSSGCLAQDSLDQVSKPPNLHTCTDQFCAHNQCIQPAHVHICCTPTCTPLLSRAIIELSIPLSRKVPRFQTPHAPAQPYYPRAHNLKKAQRNTISIVIPVNSPNHATCTECSQRMPSIVLPPARLASSRIR